jgi:hypothetical protein
MSIVDEINGAWGWTGIDAARVLAENEFGNLLIEDRRQRYWRLCPEELNCIVVAKHRAEFDELSLDPEFVQDWYMERIVEMARSELGPLGDGRKYCLKIPCVLGGEYAPANLATIALDELIRSSGDLGLQISDLPDGTMIQLVAKRLR